MGWQAVPRFLGWLLLGLALVAAGADGLRALEEGHPVLSGLAERWAGLDPSAAGTMQSVAEALPWPLRAVAGWLGRQPAVLVLALAAMLLITLFRRRAPRRRIRVGTRLG